jgi:hypothetical protein
VQPQTAGGHVHGCVRPHNIADREPTAAGGQTRERERGASLTCYSRCSVDRRWRERETCSSSLEPLATLAEPHPWSEQHVRRAR